MLFFSKNRRENEMIVSSLQQEMTELKQNLQAKDIENEKLREQLHKKEVEATLLTNGSNVNEESLVTLRKQLDSMHQLAVKNFLMLERAVDQG